MAILSSIPSVPFLSRPSPMPIPIEGKVFAVLGADGDYFDESATLVERVVVREAGLRVNIILDVFVKNEGNISKDTQRVSGDIRGVILRDILQVTVVDLNNLREGRVPEGAHIQELGELTIDFNGGELRVFIPKFEINPERSIKSSILLGEQLFSSYYDLHPDVENFSDAFESICKTSGYRISSEEMQIVKKEMIPRLLEARDFLVRIHKSSEGAQLHEIKISGKLSDQQSKYLFFPGKAGQPDRYASVKILPNGMISFHIHAYKLEGGFKKASYKIVSWVDSPVFEVKVKVSPRTLMRGIPEELMSVHREWEITSCLGVDDHPNIIKCGHIFTRKISPTSVVTEVYLDPAENLEKFLKGDFIRMLQGCESEAEYIDLLRQMMQVMIDIAEAVDYIHRSNYLHLDIKPENIFLEVVDGEDGRIKMTVRIADFGLAVKRGDPDRNRRMGCGTKGFRLENGIIGSGTDYYAVGATFEVLANRIKELFLTQVDFSSSSNSVLRGKLQIFWIRLLNVAVSLKKYENVVLHSSFPAVKYTPKTTLLAAAGYLREFYSI